MNLDASVVIDASPEAVWRRLTDFEAAGALIPLVKSARLLDPELAPGSRLRLVLEYAGSSVSVDAIVEEADPPRALALQADVVEPAGQLMASWHLTGDGAATRLEQRARVTFSSPMIRMAARAVVARALGPGGVEASLQELKAAVEAAEGA